MKKNKQLQNEVDNNLKKYNNEESLNLLKEEVKVRGEKKVKPVVLISSLSLVMVICIVVTTVVLLLPSNQTEKTYMQDNRLSASSSIAELNDQTKYIDFHIKNVVEVTRYYDKVYNDTLFFELSIIDADTFEIFNIKVITNDNFNDYDKREYENETVVLNKVMKYSETVTFDGEIYTFNTNAMIETNKEIIIINYERLSLEAENDFITSLLEKIYV